MSKEAKASPQSPAEAQTPKKVHLGAQGYKMEQALSSTFVPVVIHPGGHTPESLKFAFYNPNYTNSYNPFYTLQKPTCGYRYSPDTDHKRKVLDVERMNIVKWRTVVRKKPGLTSASTK
ncbi:putative uncharacterized protein CIMIP3 [Heteronotia binoei]|uniref:putative uncharacterized protein CIMIP3 n=1 Tax=Heteronotia binoei TaxID=13085 RepID=UPI0029303356|nr:putative uncharacterized protein CIMIP3 [Heteronotia binoei]